SAWSEFYDYPAICPRTAVRRLLQGSGGLPTEHVRYSHWTNAIGTREPAGQSRPILVRGGCKGGRGCAGERTTSLPQLRTLALGHHSPIRERSWDRQMERRRS